MTDARTGAIRANTKAVQRLAVAQERVAQELRIANLLSAAGFTAPSGRATTDEYTKALHTAAIREIGVRP